jgi:hypothetical protein
MRPSQRPVVEPEDAFDNSIEVGGQVHQAGVSAVFHAAAVTELPAETLQVDLEDARQLLDAAAQHQPPGRRILTADLEPGCRRPAHHAIPVRNVVTVARAQLMDVEVARAGIRERLQPREALRRSGSAGALAEQQCDACVGAHLRFIELPEAAVAGTGASGGVIGATGQCNGVGHDGPLAPPLRRRCIPT